MSIAALPAWAEQIAEAFRAAGPDVSEKTISGRRAYVVADRMLGDVELQSNSLRMHLRLPAAQRDALLARPHLDPHESDTLVVVTEADRDFALEMVPHAYRHARSASPEAPAASAEEPRPVGRQSGPARRRPAR